ncbi:MAG: hypothetical protein ACYCY6_02440 [Minisyncoccota bacterium]
MENGKNMGMLLSNGPWYKNKVVLGIGVLVLIIIGAALFGSSNGSNGGDNAEDVRSGETAVVGKLACMPYKPGNQALEENCVLGLDANDGNFYALDTSKVEVAEPDLEPDAELRLVGVLTPVNPDAVESDVFDYDGVLTVRLFTSNE